MQGRRQNLVSIPQTVGPAPVLLHAPVSITRQRDGMEHTRSTIKKMSDLAREGSHSYEIRNLATRIVHDVPSKQTTAELFALYRWVRDNIRYRFDPLGLEWVQSPARTVREQAGDCDDQGTLLAALAGALGHPWRFRTVGKTKSNPRHIAAEAKAAGRWVTLDPVLEPPVNSTAPRRDMGTFGMLAPGVSTIWNERGQSMGALGGPVDSRMRELWQFSSYYTNPPPHGAPDGGALLPGVPAVSNPIYGSGNRPGFYAGKPIVLGFAPGAVQARYQAIGGGLGDVGYAYQHLGGWGILKAIGKAVGSVAKVIKKIPGAKSLLSIVPGGSMMLEAATIAGKLTKGGKKKRRSKKKKKRGGRRRARAKASSSTSNLVTRSDMKNLRSDIRSIARLSTRADVERLVRALRGDPGFPYYRKRKKRKKRVRKRSKARSKLLAKKKAQRFQKKDRRTGIFRIFKRRIKTRGKMVANWKTRRIRIKRRVLRRSSMSGPTISFQLGTAPPAADTLQRAQAAFKALARMSVPPAYRVAVVLAFQEADGDLKPDSLYGGNVRAALAWYLKRPLSEMPKARWTNPVTWVSPDNRAAPAPVVATPAPVTASAPSPAPAVVRPPPTAVVIPQAAPPRTPAPPPPPPPVAVRVPPRIVGTAPRAPAPPPPAAVKRIAPPPPTSPLLPPVKVPGFTQIATALTDPGLPPLPTRAPVALIPPRPVAIKTAPDAPPIDTRRTATPEDVVAMAKQVAEAAVSAGTPPPPVPTPAEAVAFVADKAAAGTPVVVPPLAQRAAKGWRPLPSDKAVIVMAPPVPAAPPAPAAPPPAFPAPAMGPGGEPSSVRDQSSKSSKSDGIPGWMIAAGLIYATRKR